MNIVASCIAIWSSFSEKEVSLMFELNQQQNISLRNNIFEPLFHIYYSYPFENDCISYFKHCIQDQKLSQTPPIDFPKHDQFPILSIYLQSKHTKRY
jgi:hypothetical protein